jgi:hypothetical protein
VDPKPTWRPVHSITSSARVSMAAMVKNEDDVPVVISGNKARGGVTGHHVRYVLAFGLAGSIIAFVVIGLYFSYGQLTQMISQMSTQIDPTTLVSYAIMIALALVATVLLLGDVSN